MTRPTLASFKKKALENPEVREEYEALSPAYDLRRKLIALRKAAGLTQEELAERLHTKKSNISMPAYSPTARRWKLLPCRSYRCLRP